MTNLHQVWPGGTKIIETEPPYHESMKTSSTQEESSAQEGQLSKASSMMIDQSFVTLPTSASRSLRASSQVDPKTLNVSLVTELVTEKNTPKSQEEAFYQVPPEMLTRSLQQVLAQEKKRTWLSDVDDENYWKVRTKWRADWYPEEVIKLDIFDPTARHPKVW
jgi:hypothetical protein